MGLPAAAAAGVRLLLGKGGSLAPSATVGATLGRGGTASAVGSLCGGLMNGGGPPPAMPAVEARRRILLQIDPDFSKWRDEERELFEGQDYVSFGGRLGLVCFLFGNGCEDEVIVAFLWPRLRDDSARRDVRSILARIRSEQYDQQWYYFNIERQAYYFLNGQRNTDRTPRHKAKS